MFYNGTTEYVVTYPKHNLFEPSSFVKDGWQTVYNFKWAEPSKLRLSAPANENAEVQRFFSALFWHKEHAFVPSTMKEVDFTEDVPCIAVLNDNTRIDVRGKFLLDVDVSKGDRKVMITAFKVFKEDLHGKSVHKFEVTAKAVLSDGGPAYCNIGGQQLEYTTRLKEALKALR